MFCENSPSHLSSTLSSRSVLQLITPWVFRQMPGRQVTCTHQHLLCGQEQTARTELSHRVRTPVAELLCLSISPSEFRQHPPLNLFLSCAEVPWNQWLRRADRPQIRLRATLQVSDEALDDVRAALGEGVAPLLLLSNVPEDGGPPQPPNLLG